MARSVAPVKGGVGVRKGRGGARKSSSSNNKKKNKNPNKVEPPEGYAPGVPRSIVFSRGVIGRTLRRLEQDLRKVMLPHTAAKLKESKRNSIKDFLQIAGPLKVSHFLVLSASSLAPYFRIARTPRGPTLTFKICDYSLAADVANAQSKPRVPPHAFDSPPLLVMHGLGAAESAKGQQHLKLVSVMFQNMFPAIDVSTVKLTDCKRVLLLSRDAETDTIALRHYAINAKPLGVSRSIRKLVQSHQVPDLSNYADISEFIMRGGYGSESEAEDESSHVQLPQDVGRGNRASQQSAVQLHELGPRLTLQLVKEEEGLMQGAVMFHQFVKKSPQEIAAQKRERESKEQLKKQRRQEQEANVQKKEQAKQRQREASMGGSASAANGGGLYQEGESEEGESAEEGTEDTRKVVGTKDGRKVVERGVGVDKKQGRSKGAGRKVGAGRGKVGSEKRKDGLRKSGREDEVEGGDDETSYPQHHQGGHDDAEDDDAEWYRKEVGEEPDSSFVHHDRRKQNGKRPFQKRRRES